MMTENVKEVPAIGIDLGTKMCCVMVYYNGKVELVHNRAQGNSRTTPSYVAFHEDGSDTFGHVAMEEAFRYPETTIYDVKRMIGRKWNDEQLQNDRKHWPFDVVEENGHPKIKIWGRPRYPHVISARLLAQFRLMADEHLYLPVGRVSKAVITVPAYFTESQRRATEEAAKCGGLEVLSLLSEPTAAAIAYNWERRDNTQKRFALIYDLSDTKIDVSLAVVESTNVEILAFDGDSHLGSQDFDHLLMDHCIYEFRRTQCIDLMEGKNSHYKSTRDGTNAALTRLRNQCQRAIERLWSSSRTTIHVDAIFENKNISVVVTREAFEAMSTPLIRKTIEIVDRLLRVAEPGGVISKSDVDDIILVGGYTRFPPLIRLLSEHFDGKKICNHIDPDEVVAYGAAVQAAILNQCNPDTQIKSWDTTTTKMGSRVDNENQFTQTWAKQDHFKREVKKKINPVHSLRNGPTSTTNRSHGGQMDDKVATNIKIQSTGRSRKGILLETCQKMEQQIFDGTVTIGALTKRVVSETIQQARLAASEDMLGGKEEEEIYDLFKSLGFK